MKYAKIYAALVMITVIATNVNGQVQWSIGDQWVYELRTYSPPALLSQENYIVEIVKDSVINAQSYLVVEAARPLICGILKSREYIRQEGSQIYRLSYDLSEEHLMIDFDAQDNYEIVSDLGPNRRITCQAIVQENSSTTFISGQTVRTQHLHLLNNMSYSDETEYRAHEGIGFFISWFSISRCGYWTL